MRRCRSVPAVALFHFCIAQLRSCVRVRVQYVAKPFAAVGSVRAQLSGWLNRAIARQALAATGFGRLRAYVRLQNVLTSHVWSVYSVQCTLEWCASPRVDELRAV